MRKTFCLLLLAACTLPDHGNAQNLALRDVADYPVDLSDVWGYSVNGKEYAIFGLLNAFTVIDVTDPDNIIKLFGATVDGPSTFWRDIKTFGHYAYGVHDGPFSGSSQGLVIMDLQYLPDSMPTTFWTDNGAFTEAHNIYIDENGIAYLSGHNRGGSGVLMLDVATDPLHPAIIGQYSNGYVHDCFARNDTLWTSDGSASGGGSGQKRFSVVDVTDKANPVLLGTGATPGGYSHNIWLSDDGRTAFTTDESSGAYITSHDVSDPSDIRELDRWRSRPGSNVIPHNVFVRNDFLVISYYRDGVVVLDASVPDELVEVGRYDTSPSLSGNGFNGCWGVYPYLPSGNILAADIERGLYVLTPDYKRSVHVRGKVTDKATGMPLTGTNVSIVRGADALDISTDLDGKFKIGYAAGGVFTITVSRSGYTTYSDTRVLTHGDVLDLDIQLSTGNYVGNFAWDDLNENGLQDEGEPGIEGIVIRLLSDAGGMIGSDTTDENGLYGFSDVNSGSYRLQFITPSDGITRFMATLPNTGNAELDSDLQKIDNSYKTGIFTIAAAGSYLSLDGGFIKRPQTDPVDTIPIEVGQLESVTVCDDALENGIATTGASFVCGVNGELSGSSYEAAPEGCLDFTAGSTATGPVEICLVTEDEAGQITDTTIFSITVSEVISAVKDAFETGQIALLKNPVNSILYLKNQMSNPKNLMIMVSDMNGRQLKVVRDNGFNSLISFRVEELSRGMYILAVYTESQLLGIRRFIKQ